MFIVFLTIYNEIKKSLLITWEYRFDLLVPTIFYALIFVAVCYFRGEGQLSLDVNIFILSGYSMWYYSKLVISSAGASIAEEAITGTLEKLYMSPVRMEVVLIGRLISSLLIGSIQVIVFCLSLGIIMNIPISVNWGVIPVVALTILGVLGFSLMIGSAALVYKKINTSIGVVANSLMFLNGSFFGVEGFPNWLRQLAEILPTTQGIILIRKIIIEEETLLKLWIDGQFLPLIYQSIIYLIVGILFFKIGETYARKHGLLGQY